jgi:CRP/FNR family transcriptional regulator, cyclic AMP receptor protein
MTPAYSSNLISAQITTPAFIPAPLEAPKRTLSKGNTLYYSGDTADTVYRVEEGLLKLGINLLTGKERIISVAGPGDYIGALTKAHQQYQETAEALSPNVVVKVIPLDDSEKLQSELSNAAGEQLARLRDTLEDSELPVPARLARTFVRLGERFGQISEDKHVRLTLPLTHDNFAAIVGAARETTTAVLSEMRDDGVLEGTRGNYNFNLTTLSDFAVEASFAY